ncbi:MAG: hypothetical protein QW255_01630 [Candidatus Bilamarchaeaceae archaeon]
MKKIFLILTLVMAYAFAIQPAETWTVGQIGRYEPLTHANVTTEGGNVTQLNLTGNVSTEKWAGFWGDVAGNIVLAPNTTAIFYSWTWSPANGGVVCAVAAQTGFDWTNLNPITATAIDTIWGFGTATDNATNTLTTTCNIVVNNQSVTNSAGTTTGGSLTTCAIADSNTPTAKSDVAFCTTIQNNVPLFNGQNGDYELLTATNAALGSTETYYFWLELA